MLPVYKQKIKRIKPAERLVFDWNESVNDTTLGCMECTDFDVLYNVNATSEYNVDVLTSYLHFCINNVVPKRTVKCYPNNKPWVTKELKDLLNQKKVAFKSNDRETLKTVQSDINRKISDCKRQYKVKIENLFKKDSKSAWNGIRMLTGMKKSNISLDVQNVSQFCNELNMFYARFDSHDFSALRSNLVNQLKGSDAENIEITESDVLKCLKSLKTGKAGGPDKINADILKLCASPLAGTLRNIFQQSLNECHIPNQWKLSEIIPVPKKILPPV
jgi:hypothetical protein